MKARKILRMGDLRLFSNSIWEKSTLKKQLMNIEIKCPKCSWKPTLDSLWQCTCNHLWNTFDSCAECPKCKKIWEDTSCPACQKWSKHLAWYSNLDSLLARELENVNTELEKK